MGRTAGLQVNPTKKTITSTNPRANIVSTAPKAQSATYSELFKTSGYQPSQASAVKQALQPAVLYNNINKNSTPAVDVNTTRAALGNLLNTKSGNVNNFTPATASQPTTKTTSSGSSGGGSNLTSQLQSIYQQQLSAQQNAANDLSNQLKAQQEQYQAQLRAMQEAQQAAAQNAYNNNLAALQNAYNSRLSGLGSNFDSTKALLGSAYENSRQNLNSQAEKALQEAYINRMMNERNMAQQLNAQGLNGGAAESTIASMLNNYGNARNNINLSADNSLRELEQNYNSNLANALQKYNDALADAENSNMAYRMQLENDLNNNVLGSYQNMYNAFSGLDTDYMNAMYNLLMKQADDSADIQSQMYKALAKDASVSGDVTVSGSNNANVVSNVKKMLNDGATTQQILNSLTDYTYEEVAQIFAEVGLL